MAGTEWRRAAWFCWVTACTPVGLWLYEDPVVTVAGIRLNLEASSQSTAPVIIALAVKNSNDYPLSTEQVELSLRLDGVAIGSLKRDSTVQVATDTVSTVALALALEEYATPEHLQAFGSGTHNFAVRGRATFRTPIGKRKVRFAQEGDMVFARAAGSLR
ncbi:MAG TPA: LEA type 2 family protein [Gemmatimonadales bacterium]|jgi:LEA14-like dessication related protein|nr:LEA type 2 family protein [Gemmatimonadales bacterium]